MKLLFGILIFKISFKKYMYMVKNVFKIKMYKDKFLVI